MLDTSAAQIWGLNHRLLTNVMGDCTLPFEALGLDSKEFFVVAEIEECPYPVELAKRLAIPKPTITVYLKNLEAKGFVRREIDAADLRRHRLVLTTEGRLRVDRSLEILAGMFENWLARLEDHERAELQRLLHKLTDF